MPSPNGKQRQKLIEQDPGNPSDEVYVLRRSRYQKKSYHEDQGCHYILDKPDEALMRRERGVLQERGHPPCRFCVLEFEIERSEDDWTPLRDRAETGDLELEEVRELSLEELVERVKP